MTLVQVSAYRLPNDDVVVTASQLFPLPDIEEFTVRPRAVNVEPTGDATAYPNVEWTLDDLRALTGKVNATVRAILDRCAEHPGTPLPYAAVSELSGRTAGQVNGDLAAPSRGALSVRAGTRRAWKCPGATTP